MAVLLFYFLGFPAMVGVVRRLTPYFLPRMLTGFVEIVGSIIS